MSNQVQSDSIEENEDIISIKGREFNHIFQILSEATKEQDVECMVEYLLKGLNVRYDHIFTKYMSNVLEDLGREITNLNTHDTPSNDDNDNYSDGNNYDEYDSDGYNVDTDELESLTLETLKNLSIKHYNVDSEGNKISLDDEDNKNNEDFDNTENNQDSNKSGNSSDSSRYEIILDPKNRRFTAYPINYPQIWDMYKNQLAAFWVPSEIDFSRDYDDFLKFTENEQHFIKRIIAFFANSDGIVNWNLSERFTKDVQITEAIFAYQFQIMMENIHGEVYSLMLENIIKDPQEKELTFNAIHTIPSIKAMADWAFKWIESDKSFAHRLVAFAIVEGVFFSGAFASIFWIKTQKGNVMPGLISSNEFIARDEGMHCQFACVLYEYIENKLSIKQINIIMDEAVKISQDFMRDALPVRLIAMNQTYMDNYIEYIADRLLLMLGYKKLYNKVNPFDFMAKIGLANKNNFFEKRSTDYQDGTINNDTIADTDFSEIAEEF